MTERVIPPDYEGMSFEEVVAGIMYDNEKPFWTRRNKSEREPWQVCYHGEKGVVSPVVVRSFYDYSDATDFSIKLTADMLRAIASR